MTLNEFTPVPMSDKIYNTLRREIEDGTRAPGSRLIQNQIASEMSSSRTPVREALNRLAEGGLATWVPGRGFLVNEVGEQAVLDLRGVRYALETAALREGLHKFTAIDVTILRSICHQMETGGEGTDYFDLTRRFHLALATPCENQLLLKYLEEVWGLAVSSRVTSRYTERDEGVRTMVADYQAIIEALESDRPEQAIGLLEVHIANVYPDDLTAAS